LDKTLDAGVLYTAEADKALVVRKVGTTSAGPATLRVSGAPVLTVKSTLARTQPSSTELYGMLDLRDRFVVVPPGKKFDFVGDSGSKMRIYGEIVELAVGEALPVDLSVRAAEQAKRYVSYLRGSYALAAGASWPNGVEYTVLDFTCPAGERHAVRREMYVDISGLAAAHAPGDFALRFLVQSKPLDILDPGMGRFGVDLWSGCFVFDTTKYHALVDMSPMPMALDPGRKLTVVAKNTSGADKAAATGASITVVVELVDEMDLLEAK
jgi:hypothetical protein